MHEILLQTKSGWLRFAQPRMVISVFRLAEVLPALEEIEALVEKNQWHACGFVAYDAAPAFDPALKALQTAELPLLHFALFDQPVSQEDPALWSGDYSIGGWLPAIDQREYEQAFASIKNYIRSGHTYQVNYTFPLLADFSGDSRAFFGQLVRAQQPRYGAWLSSHDWTLCSVSPELFFTLDGDLLVSRPMKGTAARALTTAADDRTGSQLRRSEKNRAENIMIVDMLRNDMGRIAQTGSVIAKPLFALERYPNVFQLTSTVRCRTSATITQILRALFPCASITGAPKIRATEIIQELEPQPRGVYTGAIGYISPQRQAQFNVAIRTVVINNRTGQATFGAGSGIVWDSKAQSEYTECLTKAAILSQESPSFQLLETMLWSPEDDWFLLDLHLKRLRNSSRYFGYPIPLEAVRQKLGSVTSSFGSIRHRTRLLVSKTGEINLQSRPISVDEINPQRLRLSASPIDRLDPFLYHKTTHRTVYDKAAATVPEAEAVLLWNKEGEVTEATIANLVYSLDGRLYTPPVRCGLLPGVFRSHLLSQGKIRERVLRVSELGRPQKLYLANSIRGMWEVSGDPPK